MHGWPAASSSSREPLSTHFSSISKFGEPLPHHRSFSVSGSFTTRLSLEWREWEGGREGLVGWLAAGVGAVEGRRVHRARFESLPPSLGGAAGLGAGEGGDGTGGGDVGGGLVLEGMLVQLRGGQVVVHSDGLEANVTCTGRRGGGPAV